MLSIYQCCHGQRETVEKLFFPKLGKRKGILLLVREIWKGLKSQGKFKNFENRWLRLSSENTLIFSKRKGVLPGEIVQEYLRLHLGVHVLLKERICSLGDTLSMLKQRVKLNVSSMKRVWRIVKCHRKLREK